MPSLRDFQRSMRDQAFDRIDRGLLVPALLDDHPFPPEERLEIYRNNTLIGLTGALASAYPVVQRLVGEDFFAAMARDYARAHPPTRAPLLFYGGEFPSFIAEYLPAATLPYLSDVARLEAAWNHAYHAVEAEPLAPEALLAFDEARMGDLVLTPHPSLRFVASTYPILDIWRANQPDSNADRTISLDAGGDRLVVWRPDADVLVRSVGDGAFALLMALAALQPISVAWETAQELDRDFQLSGELGSLLAARIFSGVRQS